MARQAASGDRAAAGKLIESSKGFILLRVRKLAASAIRNDPSLEDDLYAEGMRGMYEALLRYDTSRSVHPLTYCAHWIDLRIRNALALVAGPASVGSPQHWREVGRPKTVAVPLEGLAETAPNGEPLADEQLMVHQEAVRKHAALHEALAELDPVDRRILKMRFLAEPSKRRTLAQAGAAVGLSRERTRQREIAALKKLLELLGAASDRLGVVRKLSRG